MLAIVVRWSMGGLAVLVALLLAGGRFGILLPLALVAAPSAMRVGRRLWFDIVGGGRFGMAGPAGGGRSQVETKLLRMTLELDSGALSGEVLGGRFCGCKLEALGFDELMFLREECRRSDPQSLSVLEAWLDRGHGTDWRNRAANSAAGASMCPMSSEEALSILGLSQGASPEEIREAHRRLMTRLHPDHGGSNWIAAKLNQARDALL
ncbi:MAG: hypothetical protein WCK65_00950 [Rhodospirillaceae bacterium]